MVNTQKRSKASLERREVEAVLEAFLDQESEAKVFALKGDWGVGKTYLVKKLLLDIEETYFYSSVFGVLSIDELKMRLWSNFQTVNKEKKTPSSILDLKKLINYTKNHSGNLSGIFGKSVGGVASLAIPLISNMVINNSLKGQLICIDDIERKSKKLQLDEFLGFAESLVEELNCKVIFIFCEDKLCDEDKKALTEYREKVIDMEVKLDPSTQENFYIGFGKDNPDEGIIYNYLTHKDVQTNNIRVLKKLQWILEKFRPHIEDFLPVIRQKIISEIILISLAKLDRKFPIPLESILSFKDYSTERLSSRTEESEALYFTAIRLGYSNSIITNEIIQFVETSVCDYSSFIEEGKRLNDREKNKKIRERLGEIYQSFYESFSWSEVKLHKDLKDYLDGYHLFLDFYELIELEEFSKAIDLDLDFYKKSWLKHRIDESNIFESLSSLQSVLQGYPDLLAELRQKMETAERTMSITQVISQSLKNDSWSKRETDYLDSRSVEEYKQWLLERHPEQYYMVKHVLSLGKDCAQTLRQAIIQIAQESKLKSWMAKNLYGIDIKKISSSEQLNSDP